LLFEVPQEATLGEGLIMKRSSDFSRALLAALVTALAGCSGGGNDTASAQSTPALVQGTVHGGQAPIVGSAVNLYAAGGSLAQARLVASTTTDANGNFQFATVSCAAGDELYATATGGNPGGGANAAIHLLAIDGACGALPGSLTINELTTVAGAYSANRFIGPSGCADCGGGGIPASVDNISGPTPGLPNAFSTAPRLVSPSTGALASLPDAASCGAASPPANCVTVRKLNTLASALAACVNSTGPTSSQCTQLFQCATVGAAWASSTSCTVPAGAAQPTDTLQAILNVARNPAKISPTGLDYTSIRNAVFSPGITAHPTDETLSRAIAGGGLTSPSVVAVDALGNVWITNVSGSAVSEFSPAGIALSPGVGYTGGGLSAPFGIAFDLNGNVWVSNTGNNTLSELASNGAPVSPAGGYTGGGLNGPEGIAIDSTNHLWIANSSNNSLSEFTAAGAAVSPTAGFTGGGLNVPTGVAIDASGTLWITNFSGASLSEFNPFGSALNGGITGGGLNTPQGIAFDPNGDIWIGNGLGTALSKFSGTGTALAASGYSGGGVSNARFVAVDAAGNVWAANNAGGSLSELSSAGAALSPTNGFAGPGVSSPFGLAVDESGNVWVANQGSATLTEFIGAAAPTRTPVVAAMTQGLQP
jgi:streptogramin lyase